MSAYKDRTMVMKLLETIKSDFEHLSKEAYDCKTQRDEYEHKIAVQIIEMNKFQKQIYELECSHQILKKQYEETIAMLRRQLNVYTAAEQQEHPPAIGPAEPNYLNRMMKAGLMAPDTVFLADLDPACLPSNLKMEGLDWFTLFNPKVKKSLKMNLVYSLDHNSVVCCVKFSLNGRYLAAGCNRRTYIYQVATGKRICVLQDDDATSQEGDLYIRSVCFSPDGQFLATGAEDNQIRIWDIASKRICNILRGHEQDIYSLDFSRDGRMLVSGSGDFTTRIWDMADGKCQHVLRVTDGNQKDPGVTSVAVSYDGRLVATGSLDKMVRVWDTHTGQLMEQLEGHRDSVYSVAFMPNNELISGSLDKTIKLWKLGTINKVFAHNNQRSKNPCEMTFVGHKDFVLSIACSHDGKWIISGSKDRSIQFWDPKTGQPQFMLQGHKNSVISVAISSGGLFASGSGDNHARIWSFS